MHVCFDCEKPVTAGGWLDQHNRLHHSGCGDPLGMKSNEARIAELEAALREAHAAVPGGSICDPQRVADDIRAIADSLGVELQH